MREIPLTQGQVALVDDWWFEELNKVKWHALWSPKTRSYCAVRNSPPALGKRKKIYMHVVIAGTPKDMVTDHIDHNTLNNLSENLRVCTRLQNSLNRNRRVDNASGFKGVFRHEASGWVAQIQFDGKMTYLGRFQTPEDAARAYDEAAKKYHGEFAKLNLPSS